MNSPFEQALIEVWRQVLVENADVVELGRERYPIGQTPNHHLREVDFVLDGNTIRGLEQNPLEMARADLSIDGVGAKLAQNHFLAPRPAFWYRS
jgi:hypothetical protein